jgi:hypothetical protein
MTKNKIKKKSSSGGFPLICICTDKEDKFVLREFAGTKTVKLEDIILSEQNKDDFM